MSRTDSSIGDDNNNSTTIDDSPLSPKTRRFSEPHILETTVDKTADTSQAPFSQSEVLSSGFALKSAPEISLTQYLERINQYCGFSTAVYLTSATYIYSIVVEKPLVKLSELNVHRLVIAALRISCKTLEDINHKQPFISKIAGINLRDLQFLEISFLFLIQFECHVDSDILLGLVKNVKEMYYKK